MTKQEQIEEMARPMGKCDISCEECKKICKQLKFPDCEYVARSKMLYAAGYRKADEVRKEAVHEITKKVIVEVEKVHDNQFIACMTRIVKRIAAEYGVEVNDEK